MASAFNTLVVNRTANTVSVTAPGSTVLHHSTNIMRLGNARLMVVSEDNAVESAIVEIISSGG